jgi:hypothetical protein
MRKIGLLSILLILVFSSFKKNLRQKEIEERIVDSLSLGKTGQFKITIRQTRKNLNEVFVEFELFENRSDKWVKKQNYKAQKDGITPLDLKFSDFNGDHFNDMTFKSGIAARGANELRSLFLFNKTKGKLIEIKNSTSYPNLLYNNELNCIDSWAIYGGSSTYFLRIENDSLKAFAEVQLFDDTLKVKELDKNKK